MEGDREHITQGEGGQEWEKEEPRNKLNSAQISLILANQL